MLKKKRLLKFLLILLLIFFTIGIIMYLCGCHDVLQPNCLRFYKTEARVLDHFTIKKTCSECVAYIYVRKSLICSSYRYYDCYTSFAVMEFNILMKRTCNLEVVTYESQMQSLEKAKTEYFLYNYYNVYVDKSSFECSSESNVTSVAIAGFSFLILTGIVLIVFLITLVNYCIFKMRNKNIKQIAITQNDNADVNKKVNNENYDFMKLGLNNPQEIQIIPKLESQENKDVNESADKAIFFKNENYAREKMSLNNSRNGKNKIDFEKDADYIKCEKAEEDNNVLEIKHEKEDKYLEKIEMTDLKDAPLPDFKKG